jgi:hypothetical protein
VVLRSGGFLDTVVDGLTGTFFDAPVVDHVARAITMATKQARDEDELQAHAELFSEASFKRRIRHVIAEEVALACPAMQLHLTRFLWLPTTNPRSFVRTTARACNRHERRQLLRDSPYKTPICRPELVPA